MKFAIVITLDAYKRFNSQDIRAGRHEMFIDSEAHPIFGAHLSAHERRALRP